MASTYLADSTAAATQLLEPPAHVDGARHRMPRQTRTGAPLLGVTAMTAALGATGFGAATPASAAAPAPAVTVGDEASEHVLAADPGLALAARIQQQADGQHTTAEEDARLAAAQEAEAKRAAARQSQAHIALPVARYTLSAHYGQAGSYWSHLHTGLDFAAPDGTPVTAIAAGTVSAAGWSGAYGYRVIQTLPDGTELWYCHLSRIATAAGPVSPGTPLGTVGATGNVTGPHLHLEVRPAPGAPVDPLAWLQAHGLNP